MKLSADILHNELAKQYRITRSGPSDSGLSLLRPEFYMEGDDTFLKDHLYLATAEHLPRRPKIQRGAVLVCIGDSLNLRYYEERLCLLIIHNKADFFKAYQQIQSIFSRYDEWERNLYRHLLSDNSIQDMIRESAVLFGKPIILIDSSFRYAASSATARHDDAWTPTAGGALHTDSLSSFLKDSDLMTEKHGALRIDLNNTRTLCVNLFDKQNQYEGCLYIPMGEDEFEPGIERLAEFLAAMLEKAVERNPSVLNDENPSVKTVMRTLIDEQPITQAQRLILNSTNHSTAYYCAVLQYGNRKNRIPAGYICDSFEELVEESYAIRHDDAIVCFVKADQKNGRDISEFMKKGGIRLKEFCESMNLNAGVSDVFNDLFDIRIHFHQAENALENGKLIDPDKVICTFEEYALYELVLNSLGELPSEAYFPSGLSRIISHDDASGVSYLETLKVFLEESMSYTSAARRLYIHRSTLIDRIARIEKEMNISLKNPAQRLRIEIVLKAIEIENALRNR